MTKLVNTVLERVLSEELGRQNAWLKDDMNNGFDTFTREAVIKELKEFMAENDIKIRPDFIDSAYMAEIDEDYEEVDDGYYYDALENMPCDTYGPAACTESCPNYAKCMGWEK